MVETVWAKTKLLLAVRVKHWFYEARRSYVHAEAEHPRRLVEGVSEATSSHAEALLPKVELDLVGAKLMLAECVKHCFWEVPCIMLGLFSSANFCCFLCGQLLFYCKDLTIWQCGS